KQVLEQKVANLEEAQKQVQELLVKANIVSKDDKSLQNLPLAVTEAVKARDKARAEVMALAETLARHKLLEDAAKFDPKTFDALAKDLAEAKTAVVALEKQFKVKPGMLPEKAGELEKARLALATTLATVDAKLKEAKVAKTGAEGVVELTTAREK